MKLMKQIKFTITTIILIVIVLACNKDNFEVTPDGVKIDRSSLKDWTKATHSNEVDPNYETVFNTNIINTLEITLTKAAWDSIKTDMKTKIGFDFGVGGFGRGNPGEGMPGEGNPGEGMPGVVIPGGGGGVGLPGGGMPKDSGGVILPGGGGGNASFLINDPIYVQSSVKFNGKEWYKVGFRLKGNSSLAQAWGSGIYNQRFFGFQEFSMSPAHSDNSMIRDKITSDIFREAGIPTARGAFYKLYINFGEGAKYCGVYTMFEAMEDNAVKSQFGEKSGNIYKPESDLTTFNSGSFEKKNNKTAANYSDVQSFVTALNASTRTSNPAAWRTSLESVFNVDHFIKYLAINNTIVNWDTYGAIAHNYYLYNHSSKKLMWIPWDFNFSMIPMNGGGVAGGPIVGGVIPGGGEQGGGMGQGVSIDLANIDKNWPLLKFIAADPTYFAKYKTYVKDFNEKYFQSNRMNAIIDKEVGIISAATMQEVAPYTYLPSTAVFSTAITDLKKHIATRNQVVKDFLK